MTESQTPSILLPIGRDAGPRYLESSAEPEFRVVIGDVFHTLSGTEYSVWTCAHGVPDLQGLWKRSNTIEAAAAMGIRDADAVIDRLCDVKLLQEVRVGGDDALNFAVVYRPVPLVLGMSALTAGSGLYGVAVRDRILAETNDLVHQVFVWAALFNDLWSNCERLGRLASRGEFAIDEKWSAPEMIAQLFLTGCHELLAVQALCFDIDPAVWHAARPRTADGA